MSALEAVGLHGPVRICAEEQGVAERRSLRTTEYDREGRVTHVSDGHIGETGYSETRNLYDENGRLIQWSWKSDGGSFNELLNEYDGSGKLVRSTHRGQQPYFKNGEWIPPTQPRPDKTYLYSYDEESRLLQIANATDKKDLVRYRYDAGGRKTSTRTFGENRIPPGQACAGSAVDCMEAGFGVPEDGRVEIIFNDDDQPLEAYVYDNQGTCVTRAVRTYDRLRRFITERSFIENGELLFPPEARLEWAKAGIPMEEIRTQLAQALGGKEMQASRYKHDEKNRVIEEERTMMGASYHRQERVFDDDGDLLEYREIGRHTVNQEITESYYEVRYSYEFDEHRNWIEKREKIRRSPDEEFEEFAILRREIQYF